MHGRIRRLALGATVIALVATGLAATAAAVTTSVKTYTGCLAVTGGTLTLIKEGQSPQKPCPSGSVIARFSEGDITGVLNGAGLTGGGTTGDVTLSILPSYQLPQGCAPTKIAKWNGTTWTCADDANTTYTNGTGIALTDGKFSIAEPYQLPQGCEWHESPVLTTNDTWGCVQAVPAEQSCTSGAFVNGFNGDGDVTCQTPPAGTANTYVSEAPNDWTLGVDEDTTVASLAPSAGTWFVVAKGTISIHDDATDFETIDCRLYVGTSQVDKVVLSEDTIDQGGEVPFALTAAAPTSSFSVRCTSAIPGTHIVNIKLIGVKLQ